MTTSAANALAPPEQATTADYLHLHFLVFLWGFTSILGVLMPDLDSLQVVLWRGMFTTAGLVLVLTYKKEWRFVPIPEVVRMMGTGGILAAHWLLFFLAARVANVSTCLAGLATASLWTSVLEPLITGRKFKLIDAAQGVVVLIGLNLIILADVDRMLGLLLGVLSAMCSALFSVLNVGFVRKHSALSITFYEILGCTVCVALAIPVGAYFWPEDVHLWQVPQGTTWLYMMVLAWLCTVYAYTASVSLMRKFTAFAMNLTINLEPVYSMVLAWLIFGEKEQMTLGFYLGALVILVSVLTYPGLSKRWGGT